MITVETKPMQQCNHASRENEIAWLKQEVARLTEERDDSARLAAGMKAHNESLRRRLDGVRSLMRVAADNIQAAASSL